MQEQSFIGLMSGTSLDGLDIVYCRFEYRNGRFSYEIVQAETIPYPQLLSDELKTAHKLAGKDLMLLHTRFGSWMGESVARFCEKYGATPHYIASHGHTVFHQPELGLTVQIGHGAFLAAAAGIPVICDFRSTDVALGGQGAPLVPIGDEYLFPEFDYCLNLGGFGNVSYSEAGSRHAFDICPVNIVLNRIARTYGRPYDKDGTLGRAGKLIPSLFDSLNKIDYYSISGPKSLGREWLENSFLPLIPVEAEGCDVLHTLYRHIVYQIKNSIQQQGSILVTGGGAHNRFLIELLKQELDANVYLPDPMLIDYKEALIFAFLGYLYLYGKPNCLKEVTGAGIDVIGGCLYKL